MASDSELKMKIKNLEKENYELKMKNKELLEKLAIYRTRYEKIVNEKEKKNKVKNIRRVV